MSEAGTFEQWMVTGEPGHGYPSYRFVWGLPTGKAPGRDDGRTAEDEARAFVAAIRSAELRGMWEDGPYLHHRTVTVGEWEPAE